MRIAEINNSRRNFTVYFILKREFFACLTKFCNIIVLDDPLNIIGNGLKHFHMFPVAINNQYLLVGQIISLKGALFSYSHATQEDFSHTENEMIFNTSKFPA